MPKAGPKARRGRPRKAKVVEEPQPEAAEEPQSEVVEEVQSNGGDLDTSVEEGSAHIEESPTSPDDVGLLTSLEVKADVHKSDLEDINQADKHVEKTEPENTDLIDTINEVLADQLVTNLNQEVTNLEQEVENTNEEVTDINQEIKDIKQQVENIKEELANTYEELTNANQKVVNIKQEVTNIIQEEANIKQELSFSLADNEENVDKPLKKVKTESLAEEESNDLKPIKEEPKEYDAEEEVDEGEKKEDASKSVETGGEKEERRTLDFDDEFESMETEESIYQTTQSPVGKETETGKPDEENLSVAFEQQGDLDATDKTKEHELEDTEMVSEDELPSENLKPQLDTEAVSDEELPPNNAADHLLDTEAVSEDELPPVKKKKPRSSSGDSQEKKSPVEEEKRSKVSLKRSASSNSESSDTVPSKKPAVEAKPKVLPELEKYWKAVREDPADFTGWTYLLQYVDQEHDVEAAREAYDTFLSHYPYCYGYWRKYADYEKRKGDKLKSQDVFERGLAAIPLSVDLWLHYLNHIKSTRKDDEQYIREQYKRAVDVCGIEFRSDRLWDNYIKWETEGKNLNNVCMIYDRLFTIPTQNYKVHFENFEDFVSNNPPNKILGVDEFLTLRAEVLQKLKQKPPSEAAPAANAPPGDESDDDVEKSLTYADEETKLMREKIIASRKKVYKAMSSAINERWNFEEGIKRPYFHVKPLERCQLNNWRDYLDFEIAQGNKERTIILFERCLIACALYDEFWVKYLKYLETLTGDDVENKMRNVYERACTIHHPKKPMLSLNWAYFEENHGNNDAARKILCRIEKEIPNSLQIAICRINLERRDKNFDEASRLYEHYISSNKNKYATNALSIKYARFCQKIMNDLDRGIEVLRKAIDKDKDNPRLYHQLLDLVFSKTPRGPEQEAECLSVINMFLDRETTDIEHKVLFAQHKIEFLEDFGSSATSVQKASAEYMAVLKQMKDKRRKQYEEKVKQEEKKKTDSGHSTTASSSPGSTAVPTTASTYQSTYPSSGYQQTNTSGQYQSSSYGQPPYNQYNSQSDPNYNYQNWNYSQTGYNNYNQGWGSYNYY